MTGKAENYIEEVKSKISKKSAEFCKNLRADIRISCALAYEKGYSDCLKEIEHLAEEIDYLRERIEEQKKHCEAVDAVNEKMKCFLNCKNYVKCTVNLSRPTPEHCRKCDKWELAE